MSEKLCKFNRKKVNVLAVYADRVDGHRIANFHQNVWIDLFENYVLIENKTLIPRDNVLEITLVEEEE